MATACVALVLAAPPVVAATPGPSIVGQFEVPGSPTAVAVSPSAEMIYVTNGASLLAIRASTLQAAWSIAIGAGAWDVAVHPSGSPVYVGGGHSVSVIDAGLGTVKHIIKVKAGVDALAVAPDGRQLWAMSSGPKDNLTEEDTAAGTNAGAITVIDTRTRKAIDTIPLGPIPHDILISPSGARAYVLGWGSNSIWVINAKSRTVMSKIKVRPWPEAMALNPTGSRLLVSHSPPGVQSSYAVTTINTEKRAVTGVFRFAEDLVGLAITEADLKVGSAWLRSGEGLIGVSDSLRSLDNKPGLAVIDLTTQQAASMLQVKPPCSGVLGEAGLAVARDATRAYVVTECLGHPGALTAINLSGTASPTDSP